MVLIPCHSSCPARFGLHPELLRSETYKWFHVASSCSMVLVPGFLSSNMTTWLITSNYCRWVSGNCGYTAMSFLMPPRLWNWKVTVTPQFSDGCAGHVLLAYLSCSKMSKNENVRQRPRGFRSNNYIKCNLPVSELRTMFWRNRRNRKLSSFDLLKNLRPRSATCSGT